MTTIKITDSKPYRGESLASKQPAIDGYTVRSPRDATYDDGIYSTRSRSHEKLRFRGGGDANYTSGDDEDPGLGKAIDFKQKQARRPHFSISQPFADVQQVFKGRMLLWLAYQSVGVIYGDIGTSPLYVYSSTFSSAPSYRDLVGVLSLIIWSLIMMVTIKYVFIVLRADNNGEGGTFSTYSLLSRYMNITHRDPKEHSTIEIKRYLSGDLEDTGRRMRRGVESSKFVRGLLKVVGLLSVTMIVSDGVLTPAQSVLGAVQGISVVSPDISRGVVVGVTDAILVLLFLVQPFGITKLTVAFSPIVLIWLAFNAVFGIYNLAEHDASVLKAFSPSYAFEFLIRNGEAGWRMLGGVLLAFTGLEALFADLGAFSRRAVQLSWLCYTFPCLLLGYIGQAAYISRFPEAYSNPFFNSAPPGTIYPSLVIAILAAIVASQAIITATFQLLSFLMKLSYFPQIKVVHTSKLFHGQLYIPMANWLLMIGTVLVASLYKNTTALGQAYGVCVMFVTFFDTCMVTLVALFVWCVNPLLVALPWLVFACLDGAFISSALTKVPNGAWFTITLSVVLALMLLLWRYGKEQQWTAESKDRFPTTHFVRLQNDGRMFLTERYGSSPITSVQGFGIFFDKVGGNSPMVFTHFVFKLNAVPEVAVFLHLRPLEIPSVLPEDRFAVSRLALPNCYRLVVRYGYSDEILSPDLGRVVFEQIHHYLVQELHTSPDAIEKINYDSAQSRTITPGRGGGAGEEDLEAQHHQPDMDQDMKELATPPEHQSVDEFQSTTSKEIITLRNAYNRKVLFMLGKEELKIKSVTGYNPVKIFRKIVLDVFLYVRDNTRTRMANLNLPIDKVIEVGFFKEL